MALTNAERQARWRDRLKKQAGVAQDQNKAEFRLSEPQRLQVAYHEAGHAVAAWRKRLRIREVSIVGNEDSSGRAIYHKDPLHGIRLDIDDSDRARLRAEKAIVVALAGPAASRRHSPETYDASAEGQYEGRGDFDIASDLAFHLNGSARSAEAYLGWLTVVAEDLVKADWGAIERVAAALSREETLDWNRLMEVILGARGDQGSLHIA